MGYVTWQAEEVNAADVLVDVGDGELRRARIGHRGGDRKRDLTIFVYGWPREYGVLETTPLGRPAHELDPRFDQGHDPDGNGRRLFDGWQEKVEYERGALERERRKREREANRCQATHPQRPQMRCEYEAGHHAGERHIRHYGYRGSVGESWIEQGIPTCHSRHPDNPTWTCPKVSGHDGPHLVTHHLRADLVLATWTTEDVERGKCLAPSSCRRQLQCANPKGHDGDHYSAIGGTHYGWADGGSPIRIN